MQLQSTADVPFNRRSIRFFNFNAFQAGRSHRRSGETKAPAAVRLLPADLGHVLGRRQLARGHHLHHEGLLKLLGRGFKAGLKGKPKRKTEMSCVSLKKRKRLLKQKSPLPQRILKPVNSPSLKDSQGIQRSLSLNPPSPAARIAESQRIAEFPVLRGAADVGHGADLKGVHPAWGVLLAVWIEPNAAFLHV